jgi:hypothetical protein
MRALLQVKPLKGRRENPERGESGPKGARDGHGGGGSASPEEE